MEPQGTHDVEILGIGAPIIDYVIQVNEEYLQAINAVKGSMKAIDYKTFRQVLENSGAEVNLKAGGSCANTIKGLARLDHHAAFTGKIGNDPPGQEFIKQLKLAGVKPLLVESSTPTGQLACLVTPDGERTFRDFLGASQELIPDDLHPEIFDGVKLVHIEGYTLLNEALTERAMTLAKKAGAKVSFDLANFELVNQHRSHIIHLISHYVDILFANSAETRTLTNQDPEKGCDVLKDLCEIAVVLMGPDGCWIGHGIEKFRCFAYPVEPLDTTGAGDFFAAGFLHGYLKGKHLTECAHYGALLGAEVVQQIGAEIPEEIWQKLREEIL